MKTFCLVIVLLGLFGSSCYSEDSAAIIAPDETTKTVRPYCGQNAEYIFNGPPCDTTCDTIMEQCNKDKTGSSGCFCRPGYARNSDNICIAISFCPSQVDKCKYPYEIFYESGKAPSNCQITCKTLNKKCTIVNIVAASGCYCIPGYARDENEICIPQSECPITC